MSDKISNGVRTYHFVIEVLDCRGIVVELDYEVTLNCDSSELAVPSYTAKIYDYRFLPQLGNLRRTHSHVLDL